MANYVDSDRFLDLEELGINVNEDADALTCAFNKAANHLQKLLHQVDNTMLLTLYGYYKQGSEGRCNAPKPSWYDMKAKSKWEAWHKLGDMPKEEAKLMYIKTIKIVDPTFDEAERNSHGIKVSLMVDADTVPHNELNVIDHIRKGNLDEVENCLNSESTIKRGIDKLDESGLGLIHWAADSGHHTVIDVLLRAGADIDLIDEDGQTALHYASSCGHVDCITFLLKNGSKSDIVDNDGNSPLDVAADDEIKELLR